MIDEVAHELRRARRLHQAGDLNGAEVSYVRCLDFDSSNTDALYGYGTLLVQSKRFPEAIEKLKVAIGVCSNQINYWDALAAAYERQGKFDDAIAVYQLALQQGVAPVDVLLSLAPMLHRQNKLGDAEKAYRQLIELRPQSAALQNNLALILCELGRHDEAIQHYDNALQIDPKFTPAWINLGNLYFRLNDEKKSEAAFRRFIELSGQNGEEPRVPDIRYRLARIYHRSGDTLKAENEYQSALQAQPEHIEAMCGYGALLLELGRVSESEKYLTDALALNNRNPEALCNLGNVRLKQGRNDEAEQLYRGALAMNDRFAAALYNLGLINYKSNRLTEAVELFQKAVMHDTKFVDAWLNLGITYSSLNKRKEAIYCFNKALEFAPEHPVAMSCLLPELLQNCDWNSANRYIDKIHRLVTVDHAPISPFYFLAISESAEQQLLCAKTWASQQFGATLPMRVPIRASTDRKLRIGYLSADFHNHATTQLLAEVLESHTTDRFDVFAFSYGPDDESEMRNRIEKAFKVFFDVQTFSSAEIAQLIAQSEVDILVDLKGYTRFARTEILARRPAPIQVNYLGYPGTMGASFMDYIIADNYVIPTESLKNYSEAVVYLPNCYQPNDQTRAIGKIPARGDCGLPENALVFCAFHQPYKITPTIFDTWIRLLRAVPDSVLWLLEYGQEQVENLRREAHQRGVDANRLIFAPLLPLHEHLARFSIADIFLDTYPINAHTTASEALWAGVPTITYSGETFASRVAGSVLHAAGLADCITRSLNEYYELSLSLAQSIEKRAALRQRIEIGKNQSSLFDSHAYTRDLESVYEEMWRRYRDGLTPPLIDEFAPTN